MQQFKSTSSAHSFGFINNFKLSVRGLDFLKPAVLCWSLLFSVFLTYVLWVIASFIYISYFLCYFKIIIMYNVTNSGIIAGSVVVALIIGGAIFMCYYITNLLNSTKEEGNQKQSPQSSSSSASKSRRSPSPSRKQQLDELSQDSAAAATGGSKKKLGPSRTWRTEGKHSYSHSWLVTAYKGHSGSVNDFEISPNGKYLASCAEDRTIFIWNMKNFNSKEHKNLRYNVEFDHASLISWSPDSKAFVINRATENVLEVYKVNKKSDGWISGITKGITFPNIHEEDTIGVGISATRNYLMSCSTGNQMIIWDLKGTVLSTVDTYLINTYSAKVSPCGRFVAASGFAPDVKVWEVAFSKTGEFKQVSRAYELKGHSSGVFDFAFNADSSKVATVSKDGSWKVFNIRIEFEKGEDPHLVLTSKYKSSNNRTDVKLALSPNGEVVAISIGSNLSLFNAVTGECDKIIENIYSVSIRRVIFDSAGDYILTSGERHIHVFHNVTGRKTAILSAIEKLKSSQNSAATKERLQNIIDQSEEFLNKMNEKNPAI